MKFLLHEKVIFARLLVIAYFLIFFSSCGTKAKPEDTKDIAEEHNDGKFNESKKETDAQFLVNAAEIYLMEIQLGKLAQQNSQMTDVIELGKMMETVHSKLLNTLTILATKKLVTIPLSPTDNAKKIYIKLKVKSGAGFDKDYCDRMVIEHKDAIVMFEKFINSTGDNDIKALASEAISALRIHLDHSINCQKNCDKL